MKRELSSLLLESFASVAQNKSFRVAAEQLGVTQPALSLRIQRLENELDQRLLIRSNKKVQLTETGEALLNHHQLRKQLDEEFISEYIDQQDQLIGALRIGSFSTFTRSLLLPQLVPFFKKHPKIRPNILSREIGDLTALLRNGEVDYIFTPNPIDSPTYEQLNVFQERNVLIESSKNTVNKDVYIDHDESDQTTFQFMKKQNSRPKKLQRIYLDEIYSIIDGVAHGWGRAVVPSHIVEKRKDIKILSGYKPLFCSVYLSFIRRPFYSQLHKEFLSEIISLKK